MRKREDKGQIDGYKDVITFAINDQERLLVFLDCELDNIFRYDHIKVVYIKDNHGEQVIYSNDIALDFVESLNDLLAQAASEDYLIYESSNDDLGYLWNIYLNRPSNMYFPGQFEHWIGRKYLLWSLQGIACWLYKQDSTILLEITPVYKWHSRDPEPGEKDSFISYEQFIKSYKPYVITQLSTDTIREWLRQTKRLLTIINANDEKYLSSSNIDA